jgi:tRNA(adenine34) deaminase
MNDTDYMHLTLRMAEQAAAQNEVPVGCLITYQHQIIAQAYNQSIACHDPTAHAEILALRQAGQYLKNYRLLHTTLYVTLEPCAMCIGAMIHARIQRLVFAAPDSKTGMVVSGGKLLAPAYCNHRIEYISGVLAEQSSLLLKQFFKNRR